MLEPDPLFVFRHLSPVFKSKRFLTMFYRGIKVPFLPPCPSTIIGPFQRMSCMAGSKFGHVIQMGKVLAKSRSCT